MSIHVITVFALSDGEGCPTFELKEKKNFVTEETYFIRNNANPPQKIRADYKFLMDLFPYCRLCVKCLIPFAEKQMRTLQEVIMNRKNRSFLSGAKRWFGQNKAGAAAGTSVVYGKEAPELQMRKLADLCFLVKLYKQAFSLFHTCKKDFQVSYDR